MSSRNEILGRIRKRLPQSTPLPDHSGPWITFPDREKQFADVLTSVGGHSRAISDAAELDSALQQMPVFSSAQKVVCTVTGCQPGNVDVASIDDPHGLASVDVAILPGQFAVAENGAVWVTGDAVRHRAIYFLTQHLVLVVPRSEMVDNMHQAYERIRFDGPGYGLFISGPSKTADIEQSLVIGAHGPRSLTVFLLG
jgi:L-lactate dehydrogenase complex protein LldG